MNLREFFDMGKERSIPVKRKFSSGTTELQRMLHDFLNPIMHNWNNEDFMPRYISDIAIDTIEEDNKFKIQAEVPAIEEKDLEILAKENCISIKGEKKSEKEEQRDSNYISRERFYGSFERTIYLPDSADLDKTKASYKKGLLTIEIPKKEGASKPRKINLLAE